MSDSPRLTLTIPSELRMLTVARAFVEAVCQTRNLDKRTTHSIILATGEALSHIMAVHPQNCLNPDGPRADNESGRNVTT
jgi:hypothetical protein